MSRRRSTGWIARLAKLQPLPLELRVYLAGLFDGEGSISIRHQSDGRGLSRADVTISGTDGESFQALYEAAGRPGSLRVQQRHVKHHKPLWTWSMRNRTGEWFLQQLQPWLRIRRRQADVYLQFFGVAKPGVVDHSTRILRGVLLERLKKLNHKGQP